jgi:hypothetical protein
MTAAPALFGIGTTFQYDIFMVGDINPYDYQELILPDGGRVRFDRISPGTSWEQCSLCSRLVGIAVLRSIALT